MLGSQKTPYRPVFSALPLRQRPVEIEIDASQEESMIPILERGYTPQAFARRTSSQCAQEPKVQLEPRTYLSSRSASRHPPPAPPPSLEHSRAPSPSATTSDQVPHAITTRQSAYPLENEASFSTDSHTSSASLPRSSRHGHSTSAATDCSVATLVPDPCSPLIDPYYSSAESGVWMKPPTPKKSTTLRAASEKCQRTTGTGPSHFFSPSYQSPQDPDSSRMGQFTIRSVLPEVQMVSQPRFPRRKDSLPVDNDRYSGSTIASSPVYLLFPKSDPRILQQEPKSAFDDSDDEPTTRYRSFSSSIRMPLRSRTHKRSEVKGEWFRNAIRKLFCCGSSSGQ